MGDGRKRGPNKPTVDHQKITREQADLIRERCAPVVAWWGKTTYPTMDINDLVRSVYVQGMLDGVALAERMAGRPIVNTGNEK